jgi:hypothetical protein
MSPTIIKRQVRRPAAIGTEAQADWVTLLQRAVDLDDPDFNPTARNELKGFQ